MGKTSEYHFSFASYPAVRIMILLIMGITIAKLTDLSLSFAACWLTFILTLWIISEFIFRKHFPIKSSRIAILSYSMLIIISGIVLVEIGKESKKYDLIRSEPLNLYAWEEVTIQGDIVSSGLSSSNRDVYIIRVDKTVFPEGREWKNSYKVRLYDNQGLGIKSGNKVEATVRLYEFPKKRNPHEFDYGKWLTDQGIFAHGELLVLNNSEDNNQLNWAPFRSRVQQNADQIFKGDYAPIAKALILGYKEELSPETKVYFSRSGLSHIMAVSGLHVGFIVAPLWLIIPFLWGKKWGKWVGIILLTVFLIGYAGLTGFSASVSRASLMAWLLTYGKLFHKVRNSINLTAVAAIILLLINPNQLFEIGFQLSFAAVFIILLLMPEAQRLIPIKYRFGKIGGLITIIVVSIVVQLGLFPILVYYFGEFSIVGPIANALVVPILSITVPVGLLFTLMSPINYSLFEFGIIPVTYALEWINTVAKVIGSHDYSFILFDNKSIILFIVWFTAIFSISSFKYPNIRWKLLITLLFSLNLLVAEKLILNPKYHTMEITYLDIGQGDAVHIKTPQGKHLLIDAGRWSPGSNSGDQILIPYFESMGIEKLDAIILSHPHADHIGGMPALIDKMEIDKIYQSDASADSELFANYMNRAEAKGIKINTPEAGDMIELDSSIRIFAIAPQHESRNPSNLNNRSLAVKVVYGNQSFLFTGDAEIEQERQIAERYGDFLQSNVYKVGHHGSNTSSSDELLEVVNPEISVVSLAFQNPFKHPGREAVMRLNRFSEKIKYTSKSGAVRLVSNGMETEVVNWR